jgi:hypothetical protein
MQRIMISALAAAVLMGGGVATAQPDQLAHDMEIRTQAEAAQKVALKSGDKAAIAKATARLRQADDDVYHDREEASWKVPANAAGALRSADAQLIAAKEEAQRAYASGNDAAIAAAKQRVRSAEAHQRALAHSKS